MDILSMNTTLVSKKLLYSHIHDWDYPEGYTYIKAVGRRDQATQEDIYIYTMKLWKEGRAGQRKDGNSWKE